MDPGAPLRELTAALRSGAATSVDLVRASLDRAELLSGLGAFLSLDRDGALDAARRADAERGDGLDRGPLHGVPIAVKDNLCTRGLRTTCASRFLEGWVPPFDATVVARVRAAGAVIVGKTNLDEFAMGSSNENSAFGPVLNPRDPERVPGGSSGGSAAAVAAGIVPLALGSDTGGSVRQPAALCGVVGVKPSWGRVSRYGLVAFGSSLDQVGPLARDAHGAATLLAAIAGADPLDSTCADVPVDDYAAAAGPPDSAGSGGPPLRVGLPAEYLEGITDEARRALLEPLQAADGVELVDVSLPHTGFATAAYYVLASAEASSNLARFDGIRYGRRVERPGATLEEVYVQSRTEGFGAEVKRRIMLGTFALSSGYYDAYYGKAQAARRAIARDFEQVFERVDVVAGLTSPTTAFPLGARTTDPLQMYLSDIFTIPASLAGIPGVSVPVGLDDAGLPWGLQLLAPRWREATMLRLAARLERPLPPATGGATP